MAVSTRGLDSEQQKMLLYESWFKDKKTIYGDFYDFKYEKTKCKTNDSPQTIQGSRRIEGR